MKKIKPEPVIDLYDWKMDKKKIAIVIDEVKSAIYDQSLSDIQKIFKINDAVVGYSEDYIIGLYYSLKVKKQKYKVVLPEDMKKQKGKK